MRIVNPTSKNHVHLAWLKSELYRMRSDLASDELSLIENPDLNNSEENLQREELILNKYGRSPIMETVPSQIQWHEVEIEDEDLENLYILAIWDWFIDTGKTYKLSQVPANLTSNHGHRISNFPPGAADHKTKIEAMMSAPEINTQDIILIASSENGPFTIIDGTHRSSLLALNGTISGTKAYLGIANDLSQCVWTPEWTNYEVSKTELSNAVDQGFLW
jgi:hypothetical protein